MKYRLIIILLTFIGLQGLSYGQRQLSLTNLRCEYKTNPLGISIEHPHFSWWIESTERNTSQTGYRILMAENEQQLKNQRDLFWDSKSVKSEASIQVAYSGPKLVSGKRYYWMVQITDNHGNESGWSQVAWFQMGMLDQKEWSNANWIGYELLEDSMKIVPGIHGFGNNLGAKAVRRSVVPMFRKEFQIVKKVRTAELYISGLGQYEAEINGTKVGNSFLSPGWTDYEIRGLYNIYDISSYLKPGQNVLGVIVGNGFYNINRERYRKLVIAYGYPKLIGKLKVTYQDGSSSEWLTDQSWKCAPSPIEFSSIYGGEDYNATLEQKGWSRPQLNDSNWHSAMILPDRKLDLTLESDYPVTVNQTIEVKKIEKKENGRFLYDFGQNGSGIVELKIKGQKGSVVKLIPGELITTDHEINQKASGAPFYYTYTLKGDSVETWRPKFSYYGFRYMMVEGAAPPEFNSSNAFPQVVQLVMLHTCNSSPRNGRFSTSNPLFDQIFQLIDWAIRSNLQSVITDCPHREKLGWLEQTYLMGASLHYNYDLYALYSKVVRDMIDAQSSNGLVPDIAPEYTEFVGGFRDSPEWGSAAVILPWLIWEWYGDASIVQEAMPMMQKYVTYLGSKSSNHILDHGLGDWFDYGPKSPGEAQLTPKSLTATAIYYYDVKLLGNMMRICKMEREAADMDQLARQIRKSFNDKFFDAGSMSYSTGSQTAMAMPLCTGLVEDSARPAVLNSLIKSISASGKVLTAGDVGFHFLVKALEEGGASQLLFDMNCRNDVPGYGFQLKKGATALTESWPALEEVSNNHLMLGHLMEWFYTGLAGIKQVEGSSAFKNIIIRPEVVGDLKRVSGCYHSPYGIIQSNWHKENGSMEMEIEIPANTNATVYFPFTAFKDIREGGRIIHPDKGTDNKYFCKVGSGKYTYTINF